MRLDQFIQKTLLISRSEAKKILKSNKITINGDFVHQGKRIIDPHSDQITIDGQSLVLPALQYYLVHKPYGYVCSHKDDGGRSIFRLIDVRQAFTLHCAGRLDVDTTGLVLLTDDGNWSHKITHPNYLCPKTYYVQVAAPINHDAVLALETGVLLQGDKVPTQPASVVVHTPTTLSLVITEGRYHQVKRMLAAVGNRVVALHREAIGGVDLNNVVLGTYRPLTADEIRGLNA